MRIDINSSNLFKSVLGKALNTDIDANIRGICIDSRHVEDNDLFICLQGERNHGSDFVNEDLLDKVSIVISDKKLSHNKSYLVDNSKDFLINLAIDFRSNLNVKFIGITGTNGKTSTKELLVHFLRTKFNVSYSKKSYNSTVGLPLSVLECDENSEFCVLEMGASKSGEIEYLCGIANPDFGLVTNISEAHLEGFSSFENYIDTKVSLHDFVLDNRGTFFLNKDDYLLTGGDYQCKRGEHNIVSFSMQSQDSHYYLDSSNIEQGNVCINNHLFEIPYLTETFISNFLSSYSIASTLGVSNSDIRKALQDFSVLDGRGNIINLPTIKIINDTYNANPESMRKGISELERYKRKGVNINLVLGDMLELSDQSVDLHKALGLYINDLDFIDAVYGVGSDIRTTLEYIHSPSVEKECFGSNQELIEYLKASPINDGIIYLKGSRSIELDKVVEYLNAE